MSLDTRIKPKVPPLFGCHSNLDKYRKDAIYPQQCSYAGREREEACSGCSRKTVSGGRLE